MKLITKLKRIFKNSCSKNDTPSDYSTPWFPGKEHGNNPPNNDDWESIDSSTPKNLSRTQESNKQASDKQKPNKKTSPSNKKVTEIENAPISSFTKWTWNDKENIPSVDKEKIRFHDFNINNEIMQALFDLDFQYCTPIQGLTLKDTLTGKDVIGKAQTGTGKTAAFLISIIDQLLNSEETCKIGQPAALILAPTRELVMQIEKDAEGLLKYCNNINIQSLFGGMDYEKQKRALNKNPIEIIVATPGRLLDFQRNGDIFLGKVKTLVIDEADRMLDMGFIPDVKNIVYNTPKKDFRQTLFFSATMTEDVKRLAAQWTRTPLVAEIEPEQVAVDTVKQIIYIVTENEKFDLLFNLLQDSSVDKVIVFANMRSEARNLENGLKKRRISCDLLSGEVSQKRRISTLNNFKQGKTKVLVATDVAGRGIHVDGISHVINFTLPQNPEDYVHRIGRTGRAGNTGISISFACEEDSFNIPAIEEYIGEKIECRYP